MERIRDQVFGPADIGQLHGNGFVLAPLAFGERGPLVPREGGEVAVGVVCWEGEDDIFAALIEGRVLGGVFD